MVPWMNGIRAYLIYDQYVFRAAQPDITALGDLYDFMGYADPSLGRWLAAWGPSVLDDSQTLHAVRDAYDHESFERCGDRCIPSFPQLPSRPRWTADELSLGTSLWRLAKEEREESRPRYAEPMVRIEFPWLQPDNPPISRPKHRSRKASKTAEAVKQAAGRISSDDLRRLNFMLDNMGFDILWNEKVSLIFNAYRQGFSDVMKELYLNPDRKYEGKDFDDWVVFLLSKGYRGFGYLSLAALYFFMLL
jgi:hypothetical protein